MDVPPNPTSDPVQSIFDKITEVLSAYGWTILFFVVVANLIWSHLYPKYKKWRERQENEERDAQYKKRSITLYS
ncbi:uncharacterized protein CEXT_768301 [Caerostris extrusa]|uniref:ATP synthase F0 subunit 8 n=1 Tax=Caerostris extrusa TaxID=172846 RepID=A0AAV4NMM4_CAEEX|nr:uncharacterized protein CEXT_768301 [Caerostris extrusa]